MTVVRSCAETELPVLIRKTTSAYEHCEGVTIQLSVVAVENATAMPAEDRPLHVYCEGVAEMYAATQEAWLAQVLRH